MDVEQIIKQSIVTGAVPDMLVDIPFDDVQDAMDLLGQIISLKFGEERYNDVYRIKTIMGVVGREEGSNEFRIVWRREFPEPLPPLRCRKDYIINSDVTFGFRLNETEYMFHKADGSYLGHNRVENYYNV